MYQKIGEIVLKTFKQNLRACCHKVWVECIETGGDPPFCINSMHKQQIRVAAPSINKAIFLAPAKVQ